MVATGVEQPPFACKQLERPGDGSGFSPEFLLRRCGGGIERARRGLEHDPVALLHDSQRDQHIIQQGVVRDCHEQRSTDRVNGTRRSYR
jgi:hypothetical protein